jgi:hypothetical protein
MSGYEAQKKKKAKKNHAGHNFGRHMHGTLVVKVIRYFNYL